MGTDGAPAANNVNKPPVEAWGRFFQRNSAKNAEFLKTCMAHGEYVIYVKVGADGSLTKCTAEQAKSDKSIKTIDLTNGLDQDEAKTLGVDISTGINRIAAQGWALKKGEEGYQENVADVSVIDNDEIVKQDAAIQKYADAKGWSFEEAQAYYYTFKNPEDFSRQDLDTQKTNRIASEATLFAAAKEAPNAELFYASVGKQLGIDDKNPIMLNLKQYVEKEKIDLGTPEGKQKAVAYIMKNASASRCDKDFQTKNLGLNIAIGTQYDGLMDLNSVMAWAPTATAFGTAAQAAAQPTAGGGNAASATPQPPTPGAPANPIPDKIKLNGVQAVGYEKSIDRFKEIFGKHPDLVFMVSKPGDIDYTYYIRWNKDKKDFVVTDKKGNLIPELSKPEGVRKVLTIAMGDEGTGVYEALRKVKDSYPGAENNTFDLNAMARSAKEKGGNAFTYTLTPAPAVQVPATPSAEPVRPPSDAAAPTAPQPKKLNIITKGNNNWTQTSEYIAKNLKPGQVLVISKREGQGGYRIWKERNNVYAAPLDPTGKVPDSLNKIVEETLGKDDSKANKSYGDYKSLRKLVFEGNTGENSMPFVGAEVSLEKAEQKDKGTPPAAVRNPAAAGAPAVVTVEEPYKQPIAPWQGAAGTVVDLFNKGKVNEIILFNGETYYRFTRGLEKGQINIEYSKDKKIWAQALPAKGDQKDQVAYYLESLYEGKAEPNAVEAKLNDKKSIIAKKINIEIAPSKPEPTMAALPGAMPSPVKLEMPTNNYGYQPPKLNFGVPRSRPDAMPPFDTPPRDFQMPAAQPAQPPVKNNVDEAQAKADAERVAKQLREVVSSAGDTVVRGYKAVKDYLNKAAEYAAANTPAPNPAAPPAQPPVAPPPAPKPQAPAAPVVVKDVPAQPTVRTEPPTAPAAPTVVKDTPKPTAPVVTPVVKDTPKPAAPVVAPAKAEAQAKVEADKKVKAEAEAQVQAAKAERKANSKETVERADSTVSKLQDKKGNSKYALAINKAKANLNASIESGRDYEAKLSELKKTVVEGEEELGRINFKEVEEKRAVSSAASDNLRVAGILAQFSPAFDGLLKDAQATKKLIDDGKIDQAKTGTRTVSKKIEGALAQITRKYSIKLDAETGEFSFVTPKGADKDAITGLIQKLAFPQGGQIADIARQAAKPSMASARSLYDRALKRNNNLKGKIELVLNFNSTTGIVSITARPAGNQPREIQEIAMNIGTTNIRYLPGSFPPALRNNSIVMPLELKV